MGLAEYNRKRNFAITSEPPGKMPAGPRKGKAKTREFVIQKHAASHLHYDFRLELGGVLLSWSVPKGPSLDPKTKRLAMHVEDHPLAYADFEGIIPKGQYGGGTVMLWDQGTWEPQGEAHKDYAAGNLKFILKGKKLRGGFALIKLKGRGSGRSGGGDGRWGDPRGDERSWLLIKEKDAEARDASSTGGEITDLRPESVATGRTLDEIAADKSRIWHSKTSHVESRNEPGAKAGPLPAKLSPPRAKRGAAAPDDRDGEWLHELAIEGERLLAVNDKGKVRLLSEKGTALSAAAARKHAALADAIRMLPADPLIVDGIAAPAAPGSKSVVYYLFDLPYLDGQDLRTTPLERRKALLEELVRRASESGPVRYLDHIAGNGPAFYREACRLGVGGMISRRADSRYDASAGWTEVACRSAAPERKAKGSSRTKTTSTADERVVATPSSKSKAKAKAPPAAEPALTHPDRVLWPDVQGGFTKADLAAYYREIADFILPHVAGRPLTLVRCPEGLSKSGDMRASCFYMKHSGVYAPKSLDRIKIQEKTKVGDYLVVRDVEGLIALVQMSILEIHVWNATAERLEQPDRVVFDLDPDPTVGWARVVEAAFDLRRRLEALDLESVVKTTGGKGLHVEVPFARAGGKAKTGASTATWDEAFEFSRTVAGHMERDQPGAFVTEMAKAKRRGKIFIDFLRNQRGNTAIAGYSSRARPGAPVAVPLSWDELSPKLDPKDLTVLTVPARLAKLRADPWTKVLATTQRLTRTLIRAA